MSAIHTATRIAIPNPRPEALTQSDRRHHKPMSAPPERPCQKAKPQIRADQAGSQEGGGEKEIDSLLADGYCPGDGLLEDVRLEGRDPVTRARIRPLPFSG